MIDLCSQSAPFYGLAPGMKVNATAARMQMNAAMWFHWGRMWK
jgi:hypothetical protein